MKGCDISTPLKAVPATKIRSWPPLVPLFIVIEIPLSFIVQTVALSSKSGAFRFFMFQCLAWQEFECVNDDNERATNVNAHLNV